MKKLKIVAMIPARLGSKRVKHKNLRLLAGKPLVCHVIEKCKQIKFFDEIYINSEADIFVDVARDYGVKFYKRDPQFASDTATNDQFAQDFIDHIPCDILIQINPTSPFISVADLKNFTETMIKKNYDTLHTVKEEQIEALFDNKPLNFNPKGQMPRSQDLKPVNLFVSAIMGWKTSVHTRNMKKRGNATYGGGGRTGYFALKGFSTIDIDNEDDFALAEAIIEYLFKKEKYSKQPEYYKKALKKKEHSEVSVPDILVKDGVINNDLFDVNREKVNIEKLVGSLNHKKSWSKRLINTENNSATLIGQKPGEGNRRHYHPNWNEWWYIVDGEWTFEIDKKNKTVHKGDLVFIAKNRLHRITAKGKKTAIRLAVSREDVAHVYPEE